MNESTKRVIINSKNLRIKVFSNNSISMLEKEINDWLSRREVLVYEVRFISETYVLILFSGEDYTHQYPSYKNRELEKFSRFFLFIQSTPFCFIFLHRKAFLNML